jgi:predicted methyltransferase
MHPRISSRAACWWIALALLVAAVPAAGRRQSLENVASESARLATLLDLKPGMTVAEIGAGSGQFTVAIAQRLGATGQMYSTELDKYLLEDIKHAVDAAGLRNVKVVEADETATNLPAGSCDAIFMRRVYHHLTHPAQIDASLLAALRPGGLLAVIDFEPRGGTPPPGVPANRGGHGVRPDTVIEEATGAGFRLVRTIRDWPGNMYLVLLRKPGTETADVMRSPVTIPDRWVPGYANDITGEIIPYPSAYPGQTRALLTRATDGRKRIEWEADEPPPGAADDTITFIWHAGLASGYGAHHFTLSTNGTPCATFTSGRDTGDREWSVAGEGGSTLSFKTTKVGNFNELFGLMILSVPRRLVASGRPRFSVVGEEAGSQDYYMTFLRPVTDWARVAGEQAILKGGGRAMRVEISRIGNEADAKLVAGEAALWSGRVGPGYTSMFLPAPPRAQVDVTLEVAGRQAFSGTLLLGDRVRHWEIHLLPHSHVDIGYSDPQPVVEKKQWKNLRDAVELARKTAAYPPEARFRWNVEGLWSVESYLRQASRGERLAFLTAVKQGTIGLQANYTNILTGLASPDELSHWTDFARRMRAAYGLPPIRSAMHTDIPGLSWTTVRALAEGGVRYFSSGPNYMPSLPDRGDRIGHTLEALGDKPFWWVSPSGNERVLFWMAGRGYSWFHGLNMGSAARAGRAPLLDYVRELNEAGYAWDMVQVRYTIGGDNGPVDPGLPDFVKAWNETFQWPRLVINTAEAMFAEFERRYGTTLPALSGDMTPYWEDGALSTASEESLVRAAGRRLVQAETLWSMRDPAGFPARDDAEAWRNVLLWHEHTWGAADSISQPDRPDVVAQWLYKRQFALEADRRSRGLLGAALDPAGAAPASAGAVFFDIVNTVSWARKGLVLLDADRTAGRDRASDVEGRVLPSQRLNDGRLAVLVDGVPAFGALRVRVERGATSDPASWRARIEGNATIDNDFVRVVLDETTGDIRSLRLVVASFLPPSVAPALAAAARKAPGRAVPFMATFDREKGPDFASGATGLNSYVYVPGRDPGDARAAGAARITAEEPGPLVATLRIESDAPGARSLVRRVTLVAGEETVEIEDVLDKTVVRAKESAHIAFPFHLQRPLIGAVTGDTLIRVDEGGALVVPGQNQIAGSCHDFMGAHSAVDVGNRYFGIALLTLDAPLLEIGAVTDEQQVPNNRVRTWRSETAPGPTVYAYLLNNYWHTNYKADQEGRLTFRFVLRPHPGGATTSTMRQFGVDAGFDALALRQFSADYEQPLLARPAAARSPIVRAPFRLEGPGIVATSIQSDTGDRRGLIVRLYNASEGEEVARVKADRPGAPIRVDLVEEGRKAAALPNGELRMRPFATAVVRVALPR